MKMLKKGREDGSDQRFGVSKGKVKFGRARRGIA